MYSNAKEQVNKEFLYQRISKARSSRLISNLYSTELVNKADEIWENGEEFVFSASENGVKRLFFFVEEISNLDALLKLINSGTYYFEFMTKDEEEIDFKKAGLISKLKRVANMDCNSVFDGSSQVIKYRNDVNEKLALVDDTREVNEFLWSTFRPEISHLLSDDELLDKIRKGCVTIHRNNQNKIDAILQAEVMPKRFYINQIINKAEKEVIHSILLNRLEKYVTGGGKYLYAWVESDNIASIRFHEKYGMKHDGMWNLVYCVNG